MYKQLICEKGSVLLSTFHLLLFTSFLLISLTSIVRLQVMQLQQIAFSYEAKALIEIGEEILMVEVEKNNIETGRILFREGTVDIKKETESLYTLVATLPNKYTSQSTIEIQPIVEEEIQEPLPADEEEDDVSEDEHEEIGEARHADSEDELTELEDIQHTEAEQGH